MSLRVDHLVKQYGDQLAVNDISFEAPTGKITGFLGPNGAGKSTTMKIATGFIGATTGDIWVEDVSVTKDPMSVKRITGYLPEHNPLYLDMYVKEYLSFIGSAYGMRRKQITARLDELIALCGLEIEQHKKLKALSKGYRQRVGLAKALFSDPKMLVLDEPTTGLDPNQILEIREVIKKIAMEKTVILSTHIMQEVEALCDKVVIINRGVIVADDQLQNLKKRSGAEATIEVSFDGKVDDGLFGSIANLTMKVDGNNISFSGPSERLRQDVLKVVTEHNLPLISIKDVGGSLEEIFQSLTKTAL